MLIDPARRSSPAHARKSSNRSEQRWNGRANPANTVSVGAGRSFGADPARVIAHARAYLAGMRAAGVLTALKHFPGHGSSFADSHLGFVDVTDTARAAVELAPYRALLGEGAVDSVMTAHVYNRRLDRRHPATLSRPTVTGLLRGELGWRGVVVSDDLRMGAVFPEYRARDCKLPVSAPPFSP